jgi:hypothetical protein
MRNAAASFSQLAQQRRSVFCSVRALAQFLHRLLMGQDKRSFLLQSACETSLEGPPEDGGPFS